jgi:hypothetical protein
VGRGLAVGDIFNDGRPDLLVVSIGDRARLYRNVAPDRGHWLKVRAVLPKLHNRDAYGAEVRVRAGGREWLRLISPSESYLSCGLPVALFGLGAVDQIEGVTVTWPDGDPPEEFKGGPANRELVLRKGEGKAP